jgi:hypothetical protein
VPKPADISELSDVQLNILAHCKAMFPNRWKVMIREAWMSGDYSPLGLRENQDSELQMMRNTYGPSWLVALKI